MREVIRTFVRMFLFTCAALVGITAGASYFAGVPNVLQAMTWAALPAIFFAGAVEAVVLVRETR